MQINYKSEGRGWGEELIYAQPCRKLQNWKTSNKVELQLSGLIGTVSNLDMQKMRIIGFFFENRLHWRFEVGKKFLQTTVLGYIFIYVEIKQ